MVLGVGPALRALDGGRHDFGDRRVGATDPRKRGSRPPPVVVARRPRSVDRLRRTHPLPGARVRGRESVANLGDGRTSCALARCPRTPGGRHLPARRRWRAEQVGAGWSSRPRPLARRRCALRFGRSSALGLSVLREVVESLPEDQATVRRAPIAAHARVPGSKAVKSAVGGWSIASFSADESLA